MPETIAAAARVARRLFLSGFFLWTAAPFAAPAVAQQQAFTPREENPEEFPVGAGRDDTFYFCTACHNFKLVAQQGMSRRRWDETLDWMTERHNMPKVEGKERQAMLDYLETAFPERAQENRGWQNPFLNR